MYSFETETDRWADAHYLSDDFVTDEETDDFEDVEIDDSYEGDDDDV